MTAQMVQDVLMFERKKMRWINGGRTRTRTLDPLIKRLMLSLSFHSVSCKGCDSVVVQDQSVRSKL